MSFKRQALRNLNWNWAGTLIDSLVAFLLCPYLLTRLGTAHYGVWIMIGSLTGYFGLLDLGVRGSVGRYVAFYRARQEPAAIRGIVLTALALLSAAGFLGFLATAVASWWTGPLLGAELSVDELPAVRLALLLAGINLGLQLPLNVADGVLWGCQRFDQLNAVRMPLDIARGVLSAGVVFLGGDLVSLSAVALLLTAVGGVVKLVQAVRCEPAILQATGSVDRQRLHEVFSFGIWSTVRSVTTMIPTRITPILVGAHLGVTFVAPMSIAARLIATASAILVAATGVITPIATELHASGDRHRQQDLLVEGGKYSTAASTVILALFLLLGKPLIHLWVGPDMAVAFPLLAILAVGRWVSMSQVVTRGVITAQARHQALAISSLVQAGVTLGLGYLLVDVYGIYGVVLAIAIGDGVCEGLYSLVFGCVLLEMSPWRYTARILTATLVTLGGPVLLLAAAVWWRPVTNWLDLVLYGATFSIASVVSFITHNEQLASRFSRRFRRTDNRGAETPSVALPPVEPPQTHAKQEQVACAT